MLHSGSTVSCDAKNGSGSRRKSDRRHRLHLVALNETDHGPFETTARRSEKEGYLAIHARDLKAFLRTVLCPTRDYPVPFVEFRKVQIART